jgi:hypothetical protein
MPTSARMEEWGFGAGAPPPPPPPKPPFKGSPFPLRRGAQGLSPQRWAALRPRGAWRLSSWRGAVRAQGAHGGCRHGEGLCAPKGRTEVVVMAKGCARPRGARRLSPWRGAVRAQGAHGGCRHGEGLCAPKGRGPQGMGLTPSQSAGHSIAPRLNCPPARHGRNHDSPMSSSKLCQPLLLSRPSTDDSGPWSLWRRFPPGSTLGAKVESPAVWPVAGFGYVS